MLGRVGWPHPVAAVTVTRRLAGGRSGAEVLDVLVRRPESQFASRHVVKLGPADEAEQEWTAYKKCIEGDANVLCTAIVAYGSGGLPEDREAVVYQHAAAFAALPDAPVSTLEERISAALSGVPGATEAAVATVGLLLERAGNTLYADAAPATTRSTFTWLNRTLGADVVVEVDRGEAPSTLRFGAPLPRQLSEQKRYARDVLAAACRPDGPLASGSCLRIRTDRAEPSGDGLLAPIGDVAVKVVAAQESAPGFRLADFVQDGPVDLHGRIVSTRAATHRDRVAAVVELSEVGDPWGSLQTLLTDPVDGWIAATAHGDLNPRNVVLVNDDPYLIDYARAERGQPLLSDPAWLEVCVLRDIVSKHLSWNELVRLQRTLGLAMRLGTAADEVIGDDLNPAFAAALHVLWAVRAGARALHRGSRTWWREYVAQLAIAAHRTFKWGDQEDWQLRASAAVAAVATECLGDPFEHVRDGRYFGLRQHVVDRLDPADPETAALLADMARAGLFRSRRLGASVAALRRKIVCARFAGEAGALLTELRADHEVYIQLSAFINLGAELRGGESADAVTLISKQQRVVVLGEAGSGKSTVARELQYLLASAVAGDVTKTELSPRMPVLLRASDVARGLDSENLLSPFPRTAPADLDQWLAIGALHIFVDAFNELSSDDKAVVAEWIGGLCEKYPHTPIVVCHRSFNYDPSLLGFPEVTLQDVEIGDARSYVREWLRQRERPDDADLLNAMLFDSHEHATLRDLARKPLFLWMIVEWYANKQRVPTTVGELFDQFTQWYLEERHHTDRGEQPDLRYGLADKVPFLEKIASYLVEHGNVTEIGLEQVRTLVSPLRTDWEDVLAEIVRSDLVQTDGDDIRFLHQLFQEYFAAQVLIGEAQRDRDALRDRILKFAWREPIRILLGSPRTPAELAEFILDTAIKADPVYAAALLRDSENAPPQTMGRFLDAQRTALTSPVTGETGWKSAVDALWSLGTAPSNEILFDAIAAPDVPLTAQIAAVDAVIGDGVDDPAPLVRAALAVLGDEERPVELTARVLTAIGGAELVSLVGYLWELASDRQPRLIAETAYRALEKLGIVRSPALETRMTAVFAAGLAAVEAELPETVDARVATSLLNKRRTLTFELADRGVFRPLLERVFVLDVDEQDVEWAAKRAVDSVSAEAADLVLSAESDQMRLLYQFEHGDDLVATAAAVRLLSLTEPPLTAMLSLVHSGSSPARLHVAATAVSWLGDESATFVDKIVRELAANYRPEIGEALSALLRVAPSADTGLRFRLMQHCRDVLRPKVDRTCWPLEEARRRMGFPSVGELRTLLAHSDEGAWTAYNYASAVEEVSTGAQSSLVRHWIAGRFEFDGSYKPSPDHPHATYYARAVCAFGIAEEIDYACTVAANPIQLGNVHDTGYPNYSTIAESKAGTVLPYLGYVARLIGGATAEKVWRFLDGFDASPWHPSVRRSQLVGLGVLGDWKRLLSELAQGDFVMHAAAVNVIENWVPGPCSPDEDLLPVGRWIAERLQQDLDPAERSTLEQAKNVVERRLGHYVVLEDDEKGRPPVR